MMTDDPRCLAACYWSPFLALAWPRGADPIAVRTHRVAGARRRAQLDSLLARAIVAHNPEILILEARLAQYVGFRESTSQVKIISIAGAKERLLGDRRAAHVALYHYVLDVDSRNRERAKGRPNRRDAWDRPWEKVRLVAIALAYAASLQEERGLFI